MKSVQRHDHVFINCPFDTEYRPLFEAIVFAVHDCRYVARCALEVDDASQVRIEKISQIIAECRLGIHDISRTEPDVASGLPRFNMPLELGLFLGAKRFGPGAQKRKSCLVLDRERYRFQKFCSDIAGQDISAHRGDRRAAVKIVRDRLRGAARRSLGEIPGGSAVADRYEAFRDVLPELCVQAQLDESELIFVEYVTLVVAWLEQNA